MKCLTQCVAVCATLVLIGCSDPHDHATHSTAPGDVSAPVQSGVQTAGQTQDGIVVQHAWVRPTVGEQDATGAYMTITADKAITLVGVASPAAEISEVHEMRMDGDIMRMRMAERIELSPGVPLELKPGGYHVMLMALTAPIDGGQEIELSLQFEQADGSRLEMPVTAVAAMNAGGAANHGDTPHAH